MASPMDILSVIMLPGQEENHSHVGRPDTAFSIWSCPGGEGLGMLLLLCFFLVGGRAHYISLRLCISTGCAVEELLSSPAVLMFMPELSWLLNYINKGCSFCKSNTVLEKTCHEEA